MNVRPVKTTIDHVGERGQKLKSAAGGSAFTPGITFEAEVEVALKQEEFLRKKKLEALIQEIEEEGKILMSRPHKEGVLKYKKLIKVFLDQALKKGYEIRSSRSSEKVRNKNLYRMIIAMDQKVAELMNEVMRLQKSKLKLASRIEEIRGILMDMLV